MSEAHIMLNLGYLRRAEVLGKSSGALVSEFAVDGESLFRHTRDAVINNHLGGLSVSQSNVSAYLHMTLMSESN